jgi:hypothetical protein
MFAIHDTLLTKEKWKKILCPPIKPYPFSYGNGFSPKLKVYYAFIVHKVQKTHFLNGFSTKTFKLLNGLKFNWCTSILFTTKKFITKLYP